MSFEQIIDILILLLLGATIIYAARLSIYMKSFQDRRKDMDFLLQELSASVARGENSIRDHSAAADQSAMKLQDTINEAKFLSDELRFMTEAGDNLAGRLEKLADRNRELVDLLEQAGGVGYPSPAGEQENIYNQSHSPRRGADQSFHEKQASMQKRAPAPAPQQGREQGFFIQDRDFEEDDMREEREVQNPTRLSRPNASAQMPGLKSQAERELYEALRRKPAPKRTDKVR